MQTYFTHVSQQSAVPLRMRSTGIVQLSGRVEAKTERNMLPLGAKVDFEKLRISQLREITLLYSWAATIRSKMVPSSTYRKKIFLSRR